MIFVCLLVLADMQWPHIFPAAPGLRRRPRVRFAFCQNALSFSAAKRPSLRARPAMLPYCKKASVSMFSLFFSAGRGRKLQHYKRGFARIYHHIMLQSAHIALRAYSYPQSVCRRLCAAFFPSVLHRQVGKQPSAVFGGCRNTQFSHLIPYAYVLSYSVKSQMPSLPSGCFARSRLQLRYYALILPAVPKKVIVKYTQNGV